MIAGCEETGMEIAGGMATFALPSGTVTEEAYEQLAKELLQALQQSLPVDGILVALHGATVSEKHRDADGEVLRRIRSMVGATLPIVATLDLHANISRAMAQHSTAMIAYRTNPHLDQFDRGREAALLLHKTLSGEVRPVQYLATPPMIIQLSRQYTGEGAAQRLYQDLDAVLQWPGVLSASIAMGFYYADVEEMGAAFVAVTDGDAELAQQAADWLATRAWQQRSQFTADLPDARHAVQSAMQSPRKPVVLMDIGDNIGGGSPADSTILLHELLAQNATNALVVLYDPDSVQQCLQAGIRNTVSLMVGAKTDTLHGTPVAIEGRVRTLSDGIFIEKQIRHGGWGGGDQGITAVVETAEQHTIVLTSQRMAPMSLEQLLSLGIHPEWKGILVVKGVNAPRAAYAPIAGEVLLAGTAGITCDDPAQFHYQHRRKPLFPLEADAQFTVTA
jgi:microcystin degradation protein MlrC